MNTSIKPTLEKLAFDMELTDDERKRDYNIIHNRINDLHATQQQLLNEQRQIDDYNGDLRDQVRDLETKLTQAEAQQPREVKFVWRGDSYIHVDNIVKVMPTEKGVWVTCRDHSQPDGYNSKKLEGDDAKRFTEAIAPLTAGMEVE